VSKKSRVEEVRLEDAVLRDLVARGSKFYEQGRFKEAQECFGKAEQHIDIHMTEGANKDLPKTILYHLFFLKLRSKAPLSEDDLLKASLELLREYGPPPFPHQVYLMATLVSLQFNKSISNVIKELTYSKGTWLHLPLFVIFLIFSSNSSGPETGQSAFLDDTSYLCEIVTILARLLSVIGLDSKKVESLDEDSLRVVSNAENDFIRLNLIFLSHSSGKAEPMRIPKRDRYLEIIGLFLRDLEAVSPEKSSLASLLRLCLEGFVVGELFNTQAIIAAKTQAQGDRQEPAADEQINFELFAPWSYFSVSPHHLGKDAVEPKITQKLRGFTSSRPDFSAKDLKHLLRSLQRSATPSDLSSYVQRAEVDFVNKDYAATLGYLASPRLFFRFLK